MQYNILNKIPSVKVLSDYKRLLMSLAIYYFYIFSKISISLRNFFIFPLRNPFQVALFYPSGHCIFIWRLCIKGTSRGNFWLFVFGFHCHIYARLLLIISCHQKMSTCPNTKLTQLFHWLKNK